MSNKILVYGHYHSLSFLVRYWLETVLPETQIVVAEDIGQVVGMVQKHTFWAVIVSADAVTSSEMNGIDMIRVEDPTVPIVALTTQGTSSTAEEKLLVEADVCLSLDAFQVQILPILESLKQPESCTAHRTNTLQI